MSILVFVSLLSFTCFVWGAPSGGSDHDHHDHHHDEGTLKIFHKISEAANDLNFNLLKILHEGNDNILTSPVNIYTALALSHLGAGGATRDELAAILKIPKDDKHAQASDYIGKYGKHVTHSDDKNAANLPTIVKAANGIFVDKTISIKPTYSEKLKSNYDGEVVSADFADGNAAKNSVNKWASEKTEGRIPEILSSDLDSATRLIIASALYFNGKWKEMFPATATVTEKFNTGAGEVEVQMMSNKKYVPYYDNPSLQFEAIQVPYEGNEYAVSFVLPYATQTLANLTNYLNALEIHRVFNESKEAGIHYKVPRTKFSNQRSLVKPLNKLGLKALFERADLTNMVVENVPLTVSDFLHAGEIEVDESGTRASAITILTVVTYALPLQPVDPKPFYLNRPFMLFLYHRPTCGILFSGVVHKPNA